MRQKYSISREGAKNKLKIREYGVTHKSLKNRTTSILNKAVYSFCAEETYESVVILESIQQGVNALVETLRTPNLFPIGPHAVKIAESVMELYESEGEDSVELFFDDIDLFEE